MTHYSYLKESALESSGYTRGYKTGSLSYLENGEINFSDEIIYYDGQKDSDHDEITELNVTVEHNQYVYFDGEKGISEFYAKGFYPNNRAISAWKKIRYDDLRYNFSGSTGKSVDRVYLGRSSRIQGIDLSKSGDRVVGSYNLYEDEKSYYSNKIEVMANATMGPVKGTDNEYDFKYVANVTNGVVEIKDATGWTNKTGARRIDWERDALMMGNVSVTNTLASTGLLYPAAGDEEDWIPCCFSGTIPTIQNSDRSAVLKPDKILPENNCSAKQLQGCYDRCGEKYEVGSADYENCMGDCNKTCTNFTCVEGNCPGYGCIYEYSAGEGTDKKVTGAKPLVQEFRISISKKIVSMSDFDPSDAEPEDLKDYLDGGDMSENDVVTYQIRVDYGDAKTPLKNVTVTDTLPEGLNYTEGTSKLWFEQKSADAVLSDEEKWVKKIEPLGNNTVLPWSVPEIKPGRWLYIEFDTSVSAADIPKCMLFENTARAEGYVETDTERVERRADNVKAVISIDGEPHNCQGPI